MSDCFKARSGARENQPDEIKYNVHPYQQCISACTGAIITSLTMTPLDVIKTRLQAQQNTLLSNKCFLYCNGLMDHICPCTPNGFKAANNVVYRGTVDAFFVISRTEGVKTLWSGLGPTLVLAVPATVIYFVCYENLRQIFRRFYFNYVSGSFFEVNKQPLIPPLAAGMSSRTLAVSIVNPLELIRTKLQSERLSYLELRKALKGMIAREGVLGLWKGLGATLWRDVPFSGIYWTSYETIKATWNVVNPGFWFSFMGGAASGCIAAFVTTPFDVIKTHKQIAFGEKFLYPETAAKSAKEETTSAMVKKIYKTSGFRGLFAGISPRLVKIAPACAIMIASYEYGKLFFHNYNHVRTSVITS